MNVKNITNVLVADYPFHNNLKKELVSILEHCRDTQDEKSREYNNVKATMTSWNVTTPQIERLKKYVENEIYKFSPLIMAGDNGEGGWKLVWKDFWGNIYRKGEYALSHHHSPSNWSFVYFLKTKWYYSSLVFTDCGQKIRPKEGRFVCFPGHLFHHVPKHRYSDTRITLSGNLYYEALCMESWFNVTPQVSLI
tara:strand:- start:205 stop:786 length:582 start_codon:yes stop_codon:yes gene_type:complete